MSKNISRDYSDAEDDYMDELMNKDFYDKYEREDRIRGDIEVDHTEKKTSEVNSEKPTSIGTYIVGFFVMAFLLSPFYIFGGNSTFFIALVIVVTVYFFKSL